MNYNPDPPRTPAKKSIAPVGEKDCPMKASAVDEIMARMNIGAARIEHGNPCYGGHQFKPESLRCACGREYRSAIP